jgi:hypothetical protein
MYVPASPSYTPTYTPACNPPDHTERCMANGMPVTTVATWIWDGERSSDEDTHKFTPTSPPCSPMYVPKSPSYSPTYELAYSPPGHTERCMVNGMPVTTVSTLVWDGERRSDDENKHKFSPKSAPC